MSPCARWTLLSRSPSLARSSHCLSVTTAGRAFLYGGELKPRTPVDGGDHSARGSIHSLDLDLSRATPTGGLNWSSASSPPTPLAATNPDPRVGAASVAIGECVYVFGGRGGADMSPLPIDQAGIWRCTLGAQHAAPIWERVAATNEENAPHVRSYHSMTCHGNKIFVHAGCLEKGRVGDLHVFDLTTKTWSELASAPEPARGGTVLAAVHLSGTPVLLRFGGFAGEELDTFDIYDTRADSWRIVVPVPDPRHGSPGLRAVHGFVPFVSPNYPRAVALVYHGERSPSSLGHAGAGEFWDDIWLLEATEGEPELEWKYVPVLGDRPVPAPRGWFPSASWERDGETKILLHGGLLSSNERSDELWLLEID